MKKIAVFGNTGGGKSTLARWISETTGLPLHALDLVQYTASDTRMPDEQFEAAHAGILQEAAWVIDGYGTMPTLWARLAAADCLVYIDLPLYQHFWWVTKRLLAGRTPEGWPPDSSLWRGTLSSYKVAWLCHRHLTPRYREYVRTSSGSRTLFHLRSAREVVRFRDSMRAAFARSRLDLSP